MCDKRLGNGRVSVRPSVLSIDSGSVVQPVCCLPAVDEIYRPIACRSMSSRYRSIAAGARAKAAASVDVVIWGGATQTCWYCPHSMQSRVYETVGVRPSVRLSHHSTAAAACGGFAAERHAAGDFDRQQGAQQQVRATAHVGSRVDEAEHRLVYYTWGSLGGRGWAPLACNTWRRRRQAAPGRRCTSDSRRASAAPWRTAGTGRRLPARTRCTTPRPTVDHRRTTCRRRPAAGSLHRPPRPHPSRSSQTVRSAPTINKLPNLRLARNTSERNCAVSELQWEISGFSSGAGKAKVLWLICNQSYTLLICWFRCNFNATASTVTSTHRKTFLFVFAKLRAKNLHKR